MEKPELLAPAGNLEKAKIALLYGADAVYIGGKSFSLRARASNFELEDIKNLVDFAHNLHKKVYVTMNIVPHDDDLLGLEEYLQKMEEFKVDAIITTSRYIMKTAMKLAPSVEVHVSTQNSVINSKAVEYFKNMGVKRVVLGREATLEDIIKINSKVDIDLEVFIHGGMCASLSGRCVLSNYLTNRDANRGGCAHSCRWNYTLLKNHEKWEENGFFSMGSKDLMVLKYIPNLIDANIKSFKIEGRMKSTYYLACVVKCYRELIDKYVESKILTDDDLAYFEREIKKAENRTTSVGFYDGLPKVKEQLYDDRSEHPTKEYVGIVLEYDEKNQLALIEQRNYFEVGDQVEFFGPTLKNTITEIKSIRDANTQEELFVARHPLQQLIINVDFPVQKNDMLRKVQNK